MKKLLFVLTLSVLLSSCQKTEPNPSVETTAASPEVSSSTESLGYCFSHIQDKDTITAQFQEKNGIISGSLSYHFFEKDKNSGIYTAKRHGDTLKGRYIFESEGETSWRELWFLDRGQYWVEGIGERDTLGQRYTDTQNIQFTPSLELKKTICP